MSSKRKPKRPSEPTPAQLARVLVEAEDSLKFGMMMLIRSHSATNVRQAECRLLALACFEEAAGKISTARMWNGSAGVGS